MPKEFSGVQGGTPSVQARRHKVLCLSFYLFVLSLSLFIGRSRTSCLNLGLRSAASFVTSLPLGVEVLTRCYLSFYAGGTNPQARKRPAPSESAAGNAGEEEANRIQQKDVVMTSLFLSLMPGNQSGKSNQRELFPRCSTQAHHGIVTRGNHDQERPGHAERHQRCCC